MPIALTPERAEFTGHIDIAELDDFSAWMIEDAGREVDLAACQSAHTAVLQYLISSKARVVGVEGATDWRRLVSAPFNYRPIKEVT